MPSKDEENAGLIPRAIDMIFKVSGQLKDRGWKYQMEGQFLEVYNEVVCDLFDRIDASAKSQIDQ